MKNKIVHALLCIMLCMAFIPAAAFADSTAPSVPDGIWTDHAAESFAGGSGTKADPYQIASPEQLAKLAKDVNGGETYAGKYFKLTADLDLSAHVWMPIGLQRFIGNDRVYKPFAGSFDGGEKTISGMIVDQRKDTAERYSGGLFGLIRNTDAKECGVRNLTIADGKICFYSSDNESFMGNGMLAGVAGDYVSSVVEFEGITISGGSIRSFSDAKERIAGGMLGNVAHARVSDCHVENIRISGVTNSGGFAGWDKGSVYSSCTATGELSGYWSLGGFIGYTDYFRDYDKGEDVEPVFDHCLADVDITADDWRAGGFMGWAKYAHIFNCVAKGNVTSTKSNEDPRAGVFVGVMEGCNIEKSHAAGRVTEVAPDYEAGGFAAHFSGSGNKFKDCSFDSTLNNDVKAIGGKAPEDYDGITGVTTQQVKANICRDYYGTHEAKEVQEKAATCTEDGYEAYWKCDACSSMYADKDQTTMITEPKVIKAAGHDLVKKDGKAASSTEDGYKEYWECSTCKKLFSDAKGQHEISDPEVIKATGEPADKHDNGKSASTGDSSMPVLYVILAAAALAGAALVIKRKRA